MQRLALAWLRDAAIAPAICPVPTAVALITSALFGGGASSVLRRLRSALLAELRDRDLSALLPLADERRDGSGCWPNVIVPMMRGASMDDQLDAVRAADPDDLASGIAAATEAGHPTGAFRAAAARYPARWLRAYEGALRRAWNVIAPVWSRSSGLMDREVERISVALARGAELIAQVFPFAVIDGDDLLLPSHSDRSGRLRVDGTLWLVPLVATTERSGQDA